MNSFTTCPFNPQHRMLKLRLQHHILKCQKNYISAGMKPCPYNATHYIKVGDEYRDHIQKCPDSVLIEGHRYKDDDVHGKFNEGQFHFDIGKDEDWESIDDVTDNSSEISANSSKDLNQYFDLMADYDEDDEPLQRYFFEEKKSKSGLNNFSASGSSERSDDSSLAKDNPCKDDLEESRPGKVTFQTGGGRGKLLSILSALNKK